MEMGTIAAFGNQPACDFLRVLVSHVLGLHFSFVFCGCVCLIYKVGVCRARSWLQVNSLRPVFGGRLVFRETVLQQQKKGRTGSSYV